MPPKLDKQTFIDKSIAMHGENTYDYSQVNYTHSS